MQPIHKLSSQVFKKAVMKYEKGNTISQKVVSGQQKMKHVQPKSS